MKLVGKIIQLNHSVKEKLNDLDILEKTKYSYSNLTIVEENLKNLTNRMVLDVEIILNYIIKVSRFRLNREITKTKSEDDDKPIFDEENERLIFSMPTTNELQ